MSHDRTRMRLYDALAGLLVGVLAFALPTLSSATSAADGGTTVAGALLAVTVAALLTVTREHASLGSHAATRTVRPGRSRPQVVLAGPTDTPRHPQRPRAPGRA